VSRAVVTAVFIAAGLIGAAIGVFRALDANRDAAMANIEAGGFLPALAGQKLLGNLPVPVTPSTPITGAPGGTGVGGTGDGRAGGSSGLSSGGSSGGSSGLPDTARFPDLVDAAILRPLGLADLNGNGTIDQGAGEGYEEFTARYGDTDLGFTINTTLTGAGNGRLEENEIVNCYYLRIRFKYPEETAAVEAALEARHPPQAVPPPLLEAQGREMARALQAIENYRKSRERNTQP